ncbi:hypothetical protein HFN_1612 [Helicobacter fennelliae MRY12-0050]|uniref:Uncharacterized protein n=1 Tax=Helicobacter fennelliae MRY12-0050 TaxID=1325130 RepID=T1CTI1_9HELI|nr:hypothetical protein HFN_1612 [Helicobacter fennelliae MRY12-0050]
MYSFDIDRQEDTKQIIKYYQNNGQKYKEIQFIKICKNNINKETRYAESKKNTP